MPTTATVNISVFRKHKSHCALHVPGGKVPRFACFSSSSSPQQYPQHHNHRPQQSSGTYDAAVHAGTTSTITLPDYQRRYILAIPPTAQQHQQGHGHGHGQSFCSSHYITHFSSVSSTTLSASASTSTTTRSSSDSFDEGHSLAVATAPPPPPRATVPPPHPADAASAAALCEAARLDRQHTYYKSACNGLLLHPLLCGDDPTTSAPAATTRFHRIMDVGCGTGIWMTDYFSAHVNASGPSSSTTAYNVVVHGCDINLCTVHNELKQRVIQHDALEAFPIAGIGPEQIGRQGSYDLVHGRLLIYALDRGVGWKTAIQNMVRLLKPNGILHLSELNAVAHLPPDADLSQEQDNPIHRINQVASKTMIYLNKDQYAGTNLQSHLRGAGLETSSVKKWHIPFGKLARDRGYAPIQVEHGIRTALKAIEVLKTPYLASGGTPRAEGGVGCSSSEFDCWLHECEKAIREQGMVYEFFMCYGRRVEE